MRKTNDKYKAKTNKDNTITSAYLRNRVIKKQYKIKRGKQVITMLYACTTVVVGIECTSSLSRYVTFEFNYKSLQMKKDYERRQSIRLNQFIKFIIL